MTGHTHSLAEWASVVSGAISVYAALSVPYFVLVDAHREDFPRLWQAAVHARHDVNRAVASLVQLAREDVAYVRFSLREAALTAAALLALLLPASPEVARS
jgi:hypothetical protein